MGTRNLTVVVLDNQYRVAQYGQWDGYPAGQGASICQFIQEEMDLDKFKAAVRECQYISQDELRNLWIECGADPDGNFVSFDIAREFDRKHPQLSREAAGTVLSLIQNGARHLKNSLSFAGDSLFCEWAYVLDLDNQVLEVYKGFNKEPVPPGERFAGTEVGGVTLETVNEYYPIRLLTSIPFAEATVEAMRCLEKEEEEEEE